MTSFTLICKTCHTRRGLGLGSGGTWGNVLHAKTAEEFWDSLTPCDQLLGKNIETLNAIASHEGHDFSCYDDDDFDWMTLPRYPMEPQVWWSDDPAYS